MRTRIYILLCAGMIMAAAHAQAPVSVTTDRSTYAPTQRIFVTIHNNLNDVIAAFDEQSWCSIVTVERYTFGGWQMERGCPLARAPIATYIPGHSGFVVTLPDPYFGNAPRELGQYRIKFTYGVVLNGEISGSNVVYSRLFKVIPGK